MHNVFLLLYRNENGSTKKIIVSFVSLVFQIHYALHVCNRDPLTLLSMQSEFARQKSGLLTKAGIYFA